MNLSDLGFTEECGVYSYKDIFKYRLNRSLYCTLRYINDYDDIMYVIKCISEDKFDHIGHGLYTERQAKRWLIDNSSSISDTHNIFLDKFIYEKLGNKDVIEVTDLINKSIDVMSVDKFMRKCVESLSFDESEFNIKGNLGDYNMLSDTLLYKIDCKTAYVVHLGSVPTLKEVELHELRSTLLKYSTSELMNGI